MDRTAWETWRRLPAGAEKRRLQTKLLKGDEALVKSCVHSFMTRSAYYTANMKDDLGQAARIGMMRAMEAWKPDKGAFSTCAYLWIWHEMQLVVRHATGISVPKSAFIPRAKQEEAAKFLAKHGREPEPAEIGLTEIVIDRARKAMVTFGSIEEGHEVPDTSVTDPGEMMDKKRDAASLSEFIGKLSHKEQREFWTGRRPDLTERAKLYVQGKRACPR